MVGLLDLRACGQSDITSAEKRGVFGDLWLSCFFQSGEEESQCEWCVVLISPLSLFLRAGVSSLLVLSAFFWSGSAVEILVFYIVFLFWLDQIGFSLKVMDFHFLTNLIAISLCADPMHRGSFFYFEESLSIDNIRWMLLWVLVVIIIVCVW